MNTPSWTNPIPACPINAISVAADGANGWALSLTGELYYFRDSTQLWEEIPSPSEYAIAKISSGPDSSLIAITTHGEVFQYSGGNWGSLPSGIAHVAVGNASNYIIGDSYGNYYRSFNGTQSPVTTTWMTDLKQVSTVPAMDHVWGLKDVTTDNVFFWGGDWIHVPGKNLNQMDLHYNTINGSLQVIGVDANGAGWAFNNMTGVWASVSRVVFGAKFTTLESSDNYVWACSDIGTGVTVHRGSFTPL